MREITLLCAEVQFAIAARVCWAHVPSTIWTWAHAWPVAERRGVAVEPGYTATGGTSRGARAGRAAGRVGRVL